MVPISRGKQVAGIIGAVALGYILSWLSTPATVNGPIDDFGRNFGPSMAPVIVAPAPSRDERSVGAPGPQESSPTALKSHAYEPI
jgi:hypothetical protein